MTIYYQTAMLVQILCDKVCFGLSDVRVCKHSSHKGTVRKRRSSLVLCIRRPSINETNCEHR